MQLAPAKTLAFTDPTTGAVLFSTPMPCLAQIEACLRLEPADHKAPEAPVARQRRYLAQCLALLCPAGLSPLDWPRWLAAYRHRRAARRWLLSLQYPQLLDVYRKLMLAVQGVDFDTVEEFENALAAQKKSTQLAPLNPATRSSPASTT
jgi:hypothetical protein